MSWSDVVYVPQAKWKFGERSAIAQLRGWRSDAVCPLFKLSPPGEYDPEIDATITPELYLKLFGSQLREVRGKRPVILDGLAIQALRNEETGGLLFAELLERARLEGARPIPLIQKSASEAYVQLSCRFARRAGERTICLQIDIGELEFLTNRSELTELVERLGFASRDCVLVIDGGALAVGEPDGFASLLSNHMNRLIRPGDWSCVVWSAGSFPEKDLLKAGESGAFERQEWKLFRTMYDIREQFAVFPTFSDYLLEFPRAKPVRGVSPTAKILYSTENRFFVFKGQSVKAGEKYANIYPVADRVVRSGVFKGPRFSSGDERIGLLAKREGTTGHAGTWRWIATNHHLELVTGQLDALLELGMVEERVTVEPDQLKLV